MRNVNAVPWRIVLYVFALAVVSGMLLMRVDAWTSRGTAAETPASKASNGPAGETPRKLSDAEKLAEKALSAKEAARDTARQPDSPPHTETPPPASPRLLEFFEKGGVLMYPITFLSILVVAFGVERALGLRRGVVVPRRLVKGLKKLAAQPGGFDVKDASALCDRHASAAGKVIQAMLAKAGHADAEVERTVAAANEREASRLYLNVRWLNMAMSVAPMLGLLGTVQGMIIVFMGASQLPVGANKAEYMAEGIYLKLVCTFAGLVVAIPAAVLSYLYEARIQRLLGIVEDLALDLLPRMQRAEKRRRRAEPPDSEEPIQLE